MDNRSMTALSHSILSLYTEICRPVCKELQIPQTAFDILMLLTDHEELNTARDITDYCKIKKNLVSMHVEKLVNQGYIERQEVPGDRRQVKLAVTDKAFAVVDKGHRVQKYYYDFLTKGLTEEERKAYQKCMEVIAGNLEELGRLSKEEREREETFI